MASVDLLWEKSTAGWLVAGADLVWGKSTTDWLANKPSENVMREWSPRRTLVHEIFLVHGVKIEIHNCEKLLED